MRKKHPARRVQSRQRPNVLHVGKPAMAPDGLIKVIRHRFAIFQEAFGRDPKPNEALFFVEGLKRPVLADQEKIKDQLSDAAEKTGVELEQLLKFLGLQ